MLASCAHIIITIYISVSHECVVCRKRIFVICVSTPRLVAHIHSAYVNLDPCKRIYSCILFHCRLGIWRKGKRHTEKENRETVSAAEPTLTRVGNAFYGHYYFFLCFLFAFLFCICVLYSLVSVSLKYKFPKYLYELELYLNIFFPLKCR